MSQYHQIFSDYTLNCNPKILKPFGAIIMFAVATMLLFQLGCSSAKKSTQATKPKNENAQRGAKEAQSPAVLNEDFDPLTLKAPEFRIERKPRPSFEISSMKGGVQKSDTVTTAVAPVDTSWQTVPGYQVQLLQTEDAKLGRAAVRDAILALNTDVEIIYEAPYYKVRAGRFTNRYDAEQLQNLASEKGYANCWVVRTQVKMRASDLLNQK
jgi:hypothetical protein